MTGCNRGKRGKKGCTGDQGTTGTPRTYNVVQVSFEEGDAQTGAADPNDVQIVFPIVDFADATIFTYSTVTGDFTTVARGTYKVSFDITLQSTDGLDPPVAGAIAEFSTYVKRAGTTYQASYNTTSQNAVFNTVSGRQTLGSSFIVGLEVGDTLGVFIAADTSQAIVIDAGHFSVRKLAPYPN